jgi:hypothetical protein
MSIVNNRPQHDRSNRLETAENERIISQIERENGIVSHVSIINIISFKFLF